MSENNKTEMKIEFAPGCFDSFEGTQEELDAIIAQITEMAFSGELFEEAQDLEDDEFVEYIQPRQTRNLQ